MVTGTATAAALIGVVELNAYCQVQLRVVTVYRLPIRLPAKVSDSPIFTLR